MNIQLRNLESFFTQLFFVSCCITIQPSVPRGGVAFRGILLIRSCPRDTLALNVVCEGLSMSGDINLDNEIPGPLDPDEWCLAIIVGYESNTGLKPEALDELRESMKDSNFCRSLRMRLFDASTGLEPGQPQNYGEVFQLENPLEFPPEWFEK